ncbi:hypothetical protein [Rubrimonas cliftonensis]|uniref:Uncharacterized protein n=1 Tax=Rubrimonas cliftonensis TaxID=89524 RepID=A0A1H3W0V5_9RHOB|nr:hypothetical protein [Rubrimonas cliftonensis]SDZ80775.1 hypothetical protein SAMN05444370_101454 [Rubrimonas cliftonensis]
MMPAQEAARLTQDAARDSRTLAVARDVALDVVGRWGGGRMGRWRWLALGPLTAILAAAAAQDVAAAGGPFDTGGRIATAIVAAALFLNVAAKRLRDMRLGGWGAALALHGALAALTLVGQLHGAAAVAYGLAMFLVPGESARAAYRLTSGGRPRPPDGRSGAAPRLRRDDARGGLE